MRFFPTDVDGQSAASATVGKNYSQPNALGLAQLNGNIYMTQQGIGDVVQINSDGTFNQVIASGFPYATGILADSFNNSLYVSNTSHGPIYKVNPVTKVKTPFVNAEVDGLALSADGSILYGAVDAGALDGHVLGFSTATGAQVFDSGFIPGDIDGSALGTGTLTGNLFVNTNGGTVYEVNLATDAQTLIASGGSRGDFVTVDPNTSLLLTQTDRIIRLTPGNGGGFVGGTAVPEASSLALLGLSLPGLVGLTLRARKRRAHAA
ncbi:MAG: PEP-CTERM sorting domain-containing protein [Armatimonadetes bacterium]|nr:PEP-CTERM sorting domain-containing protein [Armatimonadota bacterium]